MRTLPLLTVLTQGLAANLQRLNPWWRGLPQPPLPPVRRWAFPIALGRLKHGLAKATVLSGPRQVGKSTLMTRASLALLPFLAILALFTIPTVLQARGARGRIAAVKEVALASSARAEETATPTPTTSPARSRVYLLLIIKGPHGPGLSPTPTNTFMIMCTPPRCRTDEALYCPDACPGGCGVRCATITPTPNPPYDATAHGTLVRTELTICMAGETHALRESWAYLYSRRLYLDAYVGYSVRVWGWLVPSPECRVIDVQRIEVLGAGSSTRPSKPAPVVP
jgi:hypothetical protein